MEIDEEDDDDEGEKETSNQLDNVQRATKSTAKVVANPDNLNKLFMPLPKLNEQLLRDEVDVDQLEHQLTELEKRKRKQSVANLTLVLDFFVKLKKYQTEFKELAAITDCEQRDLHRAFHDRLKKQRLHEFMEGFREIATELRITYQMITIQGDVSLELVDSLDPSVLGMPNLLLRNQIYEKANRLIGIYKVRDCTKNVVVNPSAMSKAFEQDKKRKSNP
ncbi:hypothetical protein niasHT_028733 [Heterodera trifolii]|uniref:Uncharacterized protein n=1 Tax=Heterodera trifolii TaxID=157864 RepID=A0ABD2JCP5_9BILA